MNIPEIVPIKSIETETKTIKTIKFPYTKNTKPGQFFMIWNPGTDEIPMSVSYIDPDNKAITFKALGDATQTLSSLKPNDKINIKMDALIYDHYQLIFSNLFDRKGSNNYEKFKKNKKLPSSFPDKYLCAGRIFSLLKPNKYRLTYIYETINADKHWKFSAAKTPQETSLDLLWIGKATSRPIEISIQ